MKLKSLSLIVAMIAATTSAFAQSSPEDIIPIPSEYSIAEGTVTVPVKDVKTKINKKFLKSVQQYNLEDWQENAAYRLTISEKGIVIEASSEEGAFYGMQSLNMLSKLSDKVKCCTITDWPRFKHRGLMLDVCRNFQDKIFVEKQLDMMAMLKMNKFHFHLVDDPGWRIQIDKYPLLYQLAAWRQNADWIDWTKRMTFTMWNDPDATGGYYSKKDIAEILEYAEKLHIEVIPEIEMPGHNFETIYAYPELSCLSADGKEHLKGAHELCPANEQVYTFLENILLEVFDMFPSHYIHIGGDEAYKGNWAECPVCKEKMKKEGFDNVEQLQSYLIKRMEKFANDHGKSIIGWDEILEGGLAPNATVMSWRGTEGGLKAISEGHDVIMSPTTYYYLDYHQAKDNFRSVGPYLPIEKSYSYEPIEPGVDPKLAHHILGVQGNMWTEWVHKASHAEYMIYPRILAVAETGWSQSEDKDFTRFRKNVINWLKVMDQLGYSHYDLEHEVKE